MCGSGDRVYPYPESEQLETVAGLSSRLGVMGGEGFAGGDKIIVPRARWSTINKIPTTRSSGLCRGCPGSILILGHMA